MVGTETVNTAAFNKISVSGAVFVPAVVLQMTQCGFYFESIPIIPGGHGLSTRQTCKNPYIFFYRSAAFDIFYCTKSQYPVYLPAVFDLDGRERVCRIIFEKGNTGDGFFFYVSLPIIIIIFFLYIYIYL